MEIHHLVQGQGPVVVLIHGLFGNLSNLSNVAKFLSDNGFCCISIDALNHGKSARNAQMDYLTQANAVISHLKRHNIAPHALLGHSMGGKVAMAMAQQMGKQLGALLVADIAPVPYAPSHKAVFAALRAVEQGAVSSRQNAFDLMAQHLTMPEVIQFLLKSLEKQTDNHWRWQFDLHHLEANYAHILDWPLSGRYEGPCLFLKGEHSDYIQDAHYAATLAQFPHAKMSVLKNTGHWLHAEKSALFNRQVLRFLHALN